MDLALAGVVGAPAETASRANFIQILVDCGDSDPAPDSVLSAQCVEVSPSSEPWWTNLNVLPFAGGDMLSI